MIGVHPSTISRELKRGRGKLTGNYFPNASDDKAKKIQKEKSKQANFKLTEETIEKICQLHISTKYDNTGEIVGNPSYSVKKVFEILDGSGINTITKKGEEKKIDERQGKFYFDEK